jgi:peptidyl-tRNA hydrolase
MSGGKLASQCGHAFVDAALLSIEQRPAEWADYKQNHGIKVIMRARSLAHLERAHAEAQAAGIPSCLITDLGYFGTSEELAGKATITALGLGPAKRGEIRNIIKRFQVWKDKEQQS